MKFLCSAVEPTRTTTKKQFAISVFFFSSLSFYFRELIWSRTHTHAHALAHADAHVHANTQARASTRTRTRTHATAFGARPRLQGDDNGLEASRVGSPTLHAQHWHACYGRSRFATLPPLLLYRCIITRSAMRGGVQRDPKVHQKCTLKSVP